MLPTLFLLPLFALTNFLAAKGVRGDSQIPDDVSVTNAKRLARHLPPLSPRKFGRHVPGKPTAVERARRGTTSATIHSGYIYAYDATTNGWLGCVSTANAPSVPYSLVTNTNACLSINFPASSAGTSGPFSISITNPKDTVNLYLGVTYTYGLGKQCSTCDVGWNELSGTNQLSATPIYSTNSWDIVSGRAPDPTESIVWWYDASTNILNTQWTNTDGTTAQCYSYRYLPQYGNIYFGADLPAWQGSPHNNGNEKVIVLKYVQA